MYINICVCTVFLKEKRIKIEQSLTPHIPLFLYLCSVGITKIAYFLFRNTYSLGS
jgi:hypothetical protein